MSGGARTSRGAQAGFTLVEALIGLSISLFLVLTLATMYDANQNTYRQAGDKIDLQQSARLAMTEMSRAVRMAGYFPENFTGGGSLEDPVRIATESAVALYGDTDDDGASEVVLLCLDGPSLRVVRGAVGAASSYTCSGGDVIAENVDSLLFSFFDEDNNPLPASSDATFSLDGQTPGSLPDMGTTTARGAVRRVGITITTWTAAPPGKPEPRYTLGTVVDLRNAG